MSTSNKKIKYLCILMWVATLFYIRQIVDTLANPDAIWNGTLYKNSWEWECSLGRYLIKNLQDIKGNVVNGTIASVFCLLFLCISCAIIVELFDIRGTLQQFLVGLLIILSPNTGSLLTYYYCSDMYAFSFLCVVIALYITVKSRNKISALLAIVLICVSAAIYQAYIGMFITLGILYYIYILFKEDIGMIEFVKKGIRTIIVICGGLILYLITNKFFQRIYNVSAAEGRGFSKMGQLNFREVVINIGRSYKYFVQYYFGNLLINNSVGYRKEINVVYFLVLVLMVVSSIIILIQVWKKIFFLFFLILIPLAEMVIVVIAPEVSIQDETGVLMTPTIVGIYLLGIILFNCISEKKRTAIQKYMIILAESLVLYLFSIINITGQTYLIYNTNKMNYVAERITEEIEDKVDSSSLYKVCIIGTMENGNYPDTYTMLRESVRWTTPYNRTVWESFAGTQNCWKNYMLTTFGVNYNMCSWDEYLLVKQSGIIEHMSNFPDDGSVYITDNDMIVVKLSDSIW